MYYWQLCNMCVWYSLRNIECYISDMFFDSITVLLDENYFYSFIVIHKNGQANAFLIAHDDAD